MKLHIAVALVGGCADDNVDKLDAGAFDAATFDAGARDSGALDSGARDVEVFDWRDEHCRDRECTFVMQGVAGADDTACNGRHPTDLGTHDADGKRNCPFAGFMNTAVRRALASDGPNERKSVFVGGGRYPIWPGLAINGTGDGPDDAVIFSSYRGEEVTLEGDNCPASCTFLTDRGPQTVTPCCAIRCSACDADPRCQDLGDGCVIPWDAVATAVSISGRWVRIEGMTIDGCFSDAIAVGFRAEGDPPRVVPNDGVFIANNVIHGCQVNENVKGFGGGPGPTQGGPTWGPTHVVGNEMLEMASQAVDATGVHNWTVEDNFIHDAKVGDFMGTAFDGGGIGFKNGGSHARVRNNWLEKGGGLGGGGVSGSCIRATEPPTDWGCFQEFEMEDILVENNVAFDAPNGGLSVYQCDNCRFLGNSIVRIGSSLLFEITDDCPGPRCPAHNPRLLPSRDLRLERNFLSAGLWQDDGVGFVAYARDAHPAGPSANGMISRDNIFCAPDGVTESEAPESGVELFVQYEPVSVFALDPFRGHIGDSGSSVYNDPIAAVAACPASPPACSVVIDGGSVSWSGPLSCPECTCELALDERAFSVECSGTTSLDATPGRHYGGLRVNRPGGGTSCGSTYGVSSKVVGAGCAIAVVGETVRFEADGARCRIAADGLTPIEVSCSGGQPLSPDLTAGRHRLTLAVIDSALGQTTCSTMFTR